MSLFGDDSEEDSAAVPEPSDTGGSQDYFGGFADTFGPAFTGDVGSEDTGVSSTQDLGQTDTAQEPDPSNTDQSKDNADFNQVLEDTANQTLKTSTEGTAEKAEEPLKKTMEDLGISDAGNKYDPLAIKEDYKTTLQEAARKEADDEKLRSVAGGQGAPGGGPGGSSGGGVGGALGGALKGISSILKAANNPKQSQNVARTFAPLQQPQVGTPSYYGALLDYLRNTRK